MEILYTTTEEPNIWLTILGILLIAASIYVLWLGINYWREWKFNAAALLCILGFIILAAIGVGILKNNLRKERTLYTALIRNEADLPEITKNYEIVKQSDRTYILREKDSEFMSDIFDDLYEKFKK